MVTREEKKGEEGNAMRLPPPEGERDRVKITPGKPDRTQFFLAAVYPHPDPYSFVTLYGMPSALCGF